MFNTSSPLTAAFGTTTTITNADIDTNFHVSETSAPNKQGLKFPLVCVTPFGTISIMMAHNVNIELSVDRSLRLVCWNKFAISSNQKCTQSGILHSFGHIMQEDDKVFCYFYNGASYSFNKNNNKSSNLSSPINSSDQQQMTSSSKAAMASSLVDMNMNKSDSCVDTSNITKMAILGTQGVLFSMSHLMDAFLVSAAAARGTSALSMNRIQFPLLRDDFTLRQFYVDSNVDEQQVLACNHIVQRARYEKKEGMLFNLSINGFLIRQKENGDVEIFCRPRQIICSPTESTIHLRCSNVEMQVQSDEKGYVKCGAKRVHVSRSGMVVSDGNYTTSMDHYGRIVSAS